MIAPFQLYRLLKQDLDFHVKDDTTENTFINTTTILINF